MNVEEIDPMCKFEEFIRTPKPRLIGKPLLRAIKNLNDPSEFKKFILENPLTSINLLLFTIRVRNVYRDRFNKGCATERILNETRFLFRQMLLLASYKREIYEKVTKEIQPFIDGVNINTEFLANNESDHASLERLLNISMDPRKSKGFIYTKERKICYSLSGILTPLYSGVFLLSCFFSAKS